MTTWNDVQIGDWIRGKDGAVWGVVDRRSTGVASARFTMRRKGKPDFQADVRLSASGPEITKSADEQESGAIAAVEDVLGGRVLHTKIDGYYACPPDYTDPGSLAAHLHIMHGATFSDGEATLSALNALHDAKHAAGGGQPHRHTPDYAKRNRANA